MKAQRLFVGALVACAIAGATPTASAQETIGWLYEQCADEGGTGHTYCEAYLHGVASTMLGNGELYKQGDPDSVLRQFAICPEEGETPSIEAVVQEYVRFFGSNPDIWEDDMQMGAMFIIADMWPC